MQTRAFGSQKQVMGSIPLNLVVPSDGMRAQLDANVAITSEMEIWVVPLLLRQSSHGVQERHRGDEILGCQLARNDLSIF